MLADDVEVVAEDVLDQGVWSWATAFARVAPAKTHSGNSVARSAARPQDQPKGLLQETWRGPMGSE